MRRLLLAIPFFVFAAVATAQVPVVKVPPPQKLPLEVNSPDQSELLPVISVDGKTLYFTRTRLGLDSSMVFDIWLCHVLSDSTYSKAEFIGDNLSSHFGVAVTSVSPDNNTLYLLGRMRDDEPSDEWLHMSHRLAKGWSMPEAIQIPGLRARGTYTDYTLGPDQKTLIMAVDRDSSLGDRDLYVSFFDERSHAWSVPRWLGADINSRFTEMTPYLAADNKTLYFSSDRPGGFGEVDVYRSMRLDDSWQRWSIPENLGAGVNRPGRTSFYTEDAEGKWAYFSWRQTTSDQADIYRARVTHARAVALLHGVVRDASGKALSARVRYERLADGKELGSARSDPATGAFQLSLPGGEDYALRAEKDGYFPTSEHIDLRSLTTFQSLEKNLKLSKIEQGTAIALRNVFFETDKATLLPASYPELARVKQMLTESPDYKLEISGHTDSIGSEAHNVQLGQSRAEAVREYLVQQGVDGSRLIAKSYGSSKPVATNTTEDGRALNRRVEFTVEAAQAGK